MKGEICLSWITHSMSDKLKSDSLSWNMYSLYVLRYNYNKFNQSPPPFSACLEKHMMYLNICSEKNVLKKVKEKW